MRLPDTLTVDSLEREYADAMAHGDATVVLPLQLPMPLPFCTEAFLLQAIVSMERRAPRTMQAVFPQLDVAAESFADTLKGALGNPHVITAWVMSSAVSGKDGTSIDKAASKAFTGYLDAMDSFDFQHTHASIQERANLVCVQGSQREFIRPLYQVVEGRSEVRAFPEIRMVVQDILSQLAPDWSARAIRDVADPLTQLVRELVENSDWWARADVAGLPYRKGIRSVLFRRIPIDTRSSARLAGENSHLNAYLQSVLLARGGSRGVAAEDGTPTTAVDFIELTVMDSGPGMARRWLASQVPPMQVGDLRDIPLEQEEQAVADCYRKWATSSHDKSRGLGLFSVARMLRARDGFMRMRTGRLAYLYGTKSAERDIASRVRSAGLPADQSYHRLDDGTHVFLDGQNVDFFLRPWRDAEFAPVEGTSYSILLPV